MNVLRCFLVLAAFALMNARAQTAASSSPAKLGSMVYDWDKFTVKPTANGARRDVVELPTPTLEKFESHITTLNSGAFSHPPHHHPQEEFIILKEGTIEVNINGKLQRAGAGSMFFFASNDTHNMQNVGDKPATYLVFNLTTAATKSAPPQGAAAAALPGKLASSVFDWEKFTVTPTKTGARREIVNSPTITCTSFEGHITTLNPGESPHPAHHHPDEELVVVKEGLMEATINGVSRRGGPGSIFFYASNDEHGMKNVGTTSATYYVFRIITEGTPKAP
ncbi:MAG TPA: cupin domain-containing protein [Opitutaceae bacterium]|nr:cupin domain-containing protein [Opitutaceae bacterium]